MVSVQEIKKGDSSYFLEINICLTCAVASSNPLLAVTNVSHDVDSSVVLPGEAIKSAS